MSLLPVAALSLIATTGWCAVDLGETLRSSAIWIAAPAADPGEDLHAAFRRSIVLDWVPARGEVAIFAATRYQLFLNGRYILRGPARFERAEAEYDLVDVTPWLRPGRNVVAVLVHRDRPTGRIRQLEPGLGLVLRCDDQVIASDGTWKAMVETSHLPLNVGSWDVWASIPDCRDARRMGEWTAADFSDGDWPAAAPVDRPAPARWPRLVPRRIPLLAETEVTVASPTLPAIIDPDHPLVLEAPRIVLAYPELEIEAPAGITITADGFLENRPSTWTTRAGVQAWRFGDTHALKGMRLRVDGGSVTIRAARFVEVLYPFTVAGSFRSADPTLDHLWTMMARGAQILSEDAYVDCAERERVEWIEDSPPLYQATRLSMTSPGPNGTMYGDARLLEAMLRRTALTQREDGMVKAHTCSERWDIHAIMEDRACDWIQLAREHLRRTGDTGLARDLWPAIARQLDAFLAARTPRGLVRLREWADWGNPHRYRVFEGTALNSFIYAALVDGAAIGAAAGDPVAERYATAAAELKATINRELWDADGGTIGAGLLPCEAKDRIASEWSDTTRDSDGHPLTFSRPSIDANDLGLLAPTVHAAIYALRWNVLDPERRTQALAWLWERRAALETQAQAMVVYHLFEVLYERDDPAADAWVLRQLQTRWQEQLADPAQAPREHLGKGGAVHCYSLFPVEVLSRRVLGVDLLGPVGDRRLRIEPRLGDLPWAEGRVITELGPVDVSWKREAGTLRFAITVPPGATAEVRLPATAVTVAGANVPVTRDGRWAVWSAAAGTTTGEAW